MVADHKWQVVVTAIKVIRNIVPFLKTADMLRVLLFLLRNRNRRQSGKSKGISFKILAGIDGIF